MLYLDFLKKALKSHFKGFRIQKRDKPAKAQHENQDQKCSTNRTNKVRSFVFFYNWYSGKEENK